MLTSEQVQCNSLSMAIRKEAKGQVLKIDFIINNINRLSFFQRPISFIFKRVYQKHTICRDAIPHPCMGNQLTCTWLDRYGSSLEYRNKFVGPDQLYACVCSRSGGAI